MTQCAGWNLHLDRCAEFDDGSKAIFSINLVMPYCRDDRQDVRTTTAVALHDYPQFLFPHTWRDVAWRLYWNNGAGLPIGNADLGIRSDWPLDPAGAAAAARAVADAVKARCERSDDTFSIADEAFPTSANGSSLAHALAHLTHWPAGLSDAVLGRAFYLELAAADIAQIPAGAQVAVFPSFRFNDGTDAPVDFNPAGFVAQCNPPRWSCGDTLYQLTCQLQPFAAPAATAPAGAPGAVALSQSRLSTLDLRALVASHLHPLLLMLRSLLPFQTALRGVEAGRVAGLDAVIDKIEHGQAIDAAGLALLRNAFDQQSLAANADLGSLAAWARQVGLAGTGADVPSLRNTLQKALIQLIGCGWDRLQHGARDTLRAPHLFELLPDWPSLQRAVGGLAVPERITLGAAPADGALTVTQARSLLDGTIGGPRETSDDLSQLFGAGTDVRALFASWLRLAALAAEGSAGQDFTLRWLQGVDGYFFASPADAASWARIHQRVVDLIRTGVNTRAWYERNAQGTLDRLGAGDQAQRMAFWEDVQALAAEAAKAEAHDPTALAALQARVAQTLSGRLEAELGTAPPAPFIDGQVDNFVREILQRSSTTSSLQHEPGLSMVFDTGGGGNDSAIRGYAIALRAGVPTGPATASWDNVRARWITDTAFNLDTKHKSLLALSDGTTAWLHETYGSTVSNGQRVVAAEYVGLPLLSVPYREAAGGKAEIEPAVGKDRDFDDLAGVEFMWPDWVAPAESTALPLLGYGLCYQALATPIGNAGGVLSACRVPGTITRLQAARDVFSANGPMVMFRSRQKVDAPDVRLFNATYRTTPGSPARTTLADEADAYAMSDQTRAAAWLAANGLASRGGKQPRVALLTDGSEIWNETHRARGYTLEVRPPRAGAVFVERWLNADVLVATQGTGAFTHPEFTNATPAQIATFRDKAVASSRQPVPGSAYHPAVAAFGLTIVFGAGGGGTRHYVHPIHPLRSADGNLDIDAPASTLTVEVRAAGSNEASHYDEGKATLVLEHGEFARVTVYSLVDSEWIAGTGGSATRPRFHALSDFAEFVPDTPGGTRYHTCDGIDFIFEMAPAAPAANRLADDALVLRGPDAARHATLTLSLQSTASIPADWLHGAHYTPFDFHWTGYPLDFPLPSADTRAWLLAHANANTERPDLQGDVVFDTSFSTTPSQWAIGKQARPGSPWVAGIVERPLRDDVRPATHAAYTVQLRARFRAWLRPPAGIADKQTAASSPLNIESDPLAASVFVTGIAPDLLGQRLTVPALRTAVPLTSTHWPGARTGDDATPPRQQNGNMLIFDEAIRRTDDLAVVGGVGELIEVDLVAAREFNGVALDKIGPNPIFHKPPATGTTRRLAALAPFGLTYDQSDNGLVVQTGIMVVPEGGDGEWLLAEVRTRRMILPEVLMGTALLPTTNADDAARTPGYAIPLRKEGDDYVPLDFCIDVASGDSLAKLEFFKRGATQPDAVPLPPAPADGYRLLVSWHKGRYPGNTDGKLTWRMQVLTQVRVPDRLEWRVIGKLTCAQAGVDWLQTNAGGLLLLAVPTTTHGVKVSVVPMSDYTEGTWLHFIGNFAATPVEPDDFNLRRGGGNALTLTARPGRAPTTPACIALSVTDDNAVEFHWLLVYRPLRDVTRSGVDSDAGALVGAWRYDAGTHDFHPLDAANAAVDLAGCYAYLCTFQRNTAPSDLERQAILSMTTGGGTQALIECMFPDQAAQVTEATIRMVPKVLGQIAIA